MGYITPEAFEDAYRKIKSGPYWRVCTVLVLVAPDVDALCACKILVSLFRSDDIVHQIRPISGYTDMDRINENHMKNNADLRSVVLINCGALVDLSEFFTPNEHVTFYVIDSRRPWNLDNIFGSPQVVAFDDGDIKDDLQDVRKAYETLEFGVDLDESLTEEQDSSLTDSQRRRRRSVSSHHGSEDARQNAKSSRIESDEEVDEVDDNEISETPSKRRRSESPEGSISSVPVSRPRDNRASIRKYRRQIAEYYAQGTFFGHSAAGQVYILASKLEKVDHDMLWHAIVSLTSQYISQIIDESRYRISLQLYEDDVARFNLSDSTRKNPDAVCIRREQELRFMLYRHWSIYESMYHTSYVASRLRLWANKGRSRLQGLFAKMGIPLLQAQQNFTHMDRQLKKMLPEKIKTMAPDYGMDEPSFLSFTRSYGYRSLVSASDVVYGVSTLLEATPEVASRLGINIDWSGGEADKENIDVVENSGNSEELQPKKQWAADWWYTNFFTALDALDDIYLLESSLPLAMRLQQALLRQCANMLDKSPIKKMANFRLGVIEDGPDLSLFVNALTLNKFGLFMAEVLREIANKLMPLVLAALDEPNDRYIVIGVSAATGRRGNNRFALAFQETAQRSKARIQMDSFNSSVMEIKKDDLVRFIESLHFSL